MHARDCMIHDVLMFNANDTVEKALAEMNEEKVNGAPVVNDNGELVGMVVKSDIYRFLIAPGRNRQYPLELVMSKQLITASPDEDLLTIAQRLRESNIIAMPIVEGKQVVGFISLEDIVDVWLEQHVAKS